MWLTSNRPTALTDALMFVEDAGILDGHVPSTEIHHARAHPAMSCVERRGFERSRGLAHERNSLAHGC